MSETTNFLSNSKDTIISDISSSLWGLVKSRIKTTDYYLSKTGTIDFDSMNKEFKLLIEESFHEAMKGLKIETDKQADYRESILENADILLEWFQKEPYPAFNEELIEISNYDIKENIIRLFKSLHYQIQMKRDNSISSVFNRLKEISNTNTNRIMENSNRNTQLILEKLAIIQNPIESDKILNSWKISEPLKNAESLFKNRKYENAKVLLDALPINSNNITIEEREKYYEIYTNILLADHENQANAIPYLNKLIENSTNESKKTCRSILLLCIEKKYEEGLSKISLEIQNCNSSKDTLYELKINILLLKNEINTANDYIESIKDSFSKYIFWKTRILVCLGKYSEAEAIINKSKSVNTSDFDFKILRIQVIAYKFANNFSEKGFDISWNKKLFETILKSDEIRLNLYKRTYSLFFEILYSQDKILKASSEEQEKTINELFEKINNLRIDLFINSIHLGSLIDCLLPAQIGLWNDLGVIKSKIDGIWNGLKEDFYKSSEEIRKAEIWLKNNSKEYLTLNNIELSEDEINTLHESRKKMIDETIKQASVAGGT